MKSVREQAVLALSGKSLFQIEQRMPARDADWQGIYEECCQQAVPSLAWKSVNKEVLPTELADRWKDTVVAQAYHSLQVTWQHLQVHELMEKAGIPYVILKGCASAAYYLAPLERTMGDVDFLVRPQDFERAGKVLEAEGFVPWEEEHICHVVYRKERAHLEMHFEPAGVPHGRPGELVREYLKDIMEKGREIELEGGKLCIPSPFHHGLVLLLHTSHHLVGEGIGLRHLCDWAVFAASLSDQEFRALFEEKLKAIGMWRFAQLLTQVCIRYLGMPERRWPGKAGKEDRELTQALIRDVFAGGNFGTKDKKRWHESYLISTRGKDGVKEMSLVRQFFLSMNEIVYTHIPAARRWPVIIPFGWLIYGCRYMIRMLKGQRPRPQVSAMMEGAAQRKAVYSRLKLFEVENK